MVIEANRQNQAFKKKNPQAGSQVQSARPNSQKSDGEASSPHPSRSKSKSKSRSRSRGSGKNKQLQTYDPAFAGIQQAGQHNSGQAGSTRDGGNLGVGNNNPASRGNPPRNPPHVQGNPRREVASVPP